MLKARVIIAVLFLLYSVTNSTFVLPNKPPPRSPPPRSPPLRSPPSRSPPPPSPPPRSPTPRSSPPRSPPPSSPPPQSSPPPPPPPPTPTAFDLFVLALQWPASICAISTCGKGVPGTFTQFTLHGLWPNNNTGPQPRDCDPSTNTIEWNNDPMKQLTEDLAKYWPNLIESTSNASNEKFWDHQWKYHGTCSNMGQYDYFDQALKLLANKNLLTILENNTILPGDNSTKSIDVFNAISNPDGIGKKPLIICQKKKKNNLY